MWDRLRRGRRSARAGVRACKSSMLPCTLRAWCDTDMELFVDAIRGDWTVLGGSRSCFGDSRGHTPHLKMDTDNLVRSRPSHALPAKPVLRSASVCLIVHRRIGARAGGRLMRCAMIYLWPLGRTGGDGAASVFLRSFCPFLARAPRAGRIWFRSCGRRTDMDLDLGWISQVHSYPRSSSLSTVFPICAIRAFVSRSVRDWLAWACQCRCDGWAFAFAFGRMFPSPFLCSFVLAVDELDSTLYHRTVTSCCDQTKASTLPPRAHVVHRKPHARTHAHMQPLRSHYAKSASLRPHGFRKQVYPWVCSARVMVELPP